MTTDLDRLNQALAGRFVLERELGRGGMAVVYRAFDQRHGRQVAFKVLRAGVLGAKEAAERFLREVRIAARLVHPHILPVHDSGEITLGVDGAAVPYYVMPLVEGGTLRDRMLTGEPL